MKAEERHEVQENELAGGIYGVPNFLRNYGSYLLLGVALILLGYQAYNWYQTDQRRKLEGAWTELTEASGVFGNSRGSDPAKLRSLISKYEIHNVQALAYVALGDFYLDTLNYGEPPAGAGKLNITPQQADQQAFEAYDRVVTDYADQPLALVRARLGLGRLYENRGQWDKAKTQFEAILDKSSGFADTAFAAEAQRHLDHAAEWAKPVKFGPPSPTAATTPAVNIPIGPMPN